MHYILIVTTLCLCARDALPLDLKSQGPSNDFLNYGMKKVKSSKRLENEIIKSKVQIFGDVLKGRVNQLRKTPGQNVELVFLVDSSASIGADNFLNELKFVKKLLADFTVSYNQTRVTVVTFSDKSKVIRHIDHVTESSSQNHKCSLLEKELPQIRYSGGGTYTLGAMLEAQSVLAISRAEAVKAVFLVTDGYSNGGDPRPAAEFLKSRGVIIFTFGIKNGNTKELYDMASEPKNEHSYILNSFEEFEALARRALHEDLPSGTLVLQDSSACSTLCEEGRDCCDNLARCMCGTHSGNYVCSCRKGYYGTGLKGNCKPCPIGRYKDSDGPGDITTCKLCPDQNMLSPLGSPSFSHCYCIKGYIQDGSYCQKLACLPLLPPDNGYFVRDHCESVLDAACSIRCDTGYRREGSSTRICQEDGTWSGNDTTCVIKTCSGLRPPSNGTMICSSEENIVDTQCHFTCKAGFKLEGSRMRRCLPSSVWNGIKAYCTPIFCSPLTPLKNGIVKPESCTTGKVRYGTRCEFGCTAGLRLSGPLKTSCIDQGVWSERHKEARCIDVDQPTIQCPQDILAVTELHERYAIVEWKPAITKDVAGTVNLTMVPAVSLPIKLNIGKHKISYVAADEWANKGTCTFTVTVKDEEPPTVDSCESPPSYISREKEIEVLWEEPSFSDNSGGEVIVERYLDPGKFPQGKTIVEYLATDESDNSVSCNITIHVQPHACELPPNPANGFSNCTELEDAVNCTLGCHEGYSFAFRPNEDYFCRYDGIWLPKNNPFPFPDCSETEISNTISQLGEIAIEDGGSICGDMFLMKQIENSLQVQLEAAIRAVCADNDNLCEVATVEAVCETILAEFEEEFNTILGHGRRRRKDVQHISRLWAFNQEGWRYWLRGQPTDFLPKKLKRSAPTSEDTSTEESQGHFNFMGIMTYLLAKFFAKDIGVSQLVDFLEDIHPEPNDFGIYDFLKKFSIQFGEERTTALKKLAESRLGPFDISKMLRNENDEDKDDSLPLSMEESFHCNNSNKSNETVLSNCEDSVIHIDAGLSSSYVGGSGESDVGVNITHDIEVGRVDLGFSAKSEDGPSQTHSDFSVNFYESEYRQVNSNVAAHYEDHEVDSKNKTKGLKIKFQVEGKGEGILETIDVALRGILVGSNQGHFDLNFGELQLRVASVRLAEDPTFLCDPGSVVQQNVCVRCPIGTFFNVIYKTCQSCPPGSYQPKEGQVSCIVCPEKTSTKRQQSKTGEECKAMCLPGSFSKDSLEPCMTCGVGEYQDRYASRNCTKCPNGSTTWRRGSWVVEECKPPCPPGEISDTGLTPCLACPMDFFQQQEGQRKCLKCPEETFTYSVGSTSIFDCSGADEEVQAAYTVLETISVNACFSSPCLNGAHCKALEFGYMCQCPFGYIGQYCEQEMNECQSQPCLNNATCEDGLGFFECHCQNGFQGEICQTNVDDCQPNPCYNTAICVDLVDSFKCICESGFTGEVCDINIDECQMFLCVEGSTCVDGINDFTCICQPGYTGRHCTSEIDECDSFPCVKGSCTDLLNDFRCSCDQGYTGRQCDTEIYDCESAPCLNNGTCSDLLNGFSCKCLPGYSGKLCENRLSTDFVMKFPSSGIMNYASLAEFPVTLVAVTVCFWMRTTDKENYGTVFSYATDEFDNAFTFTDYNGFVIYINGERRITDVSATDGRWHMICVGWQSLDGAWFLFKDGFIVDGGLDFRSGQIIAANGTFVLGQEQDEKGGMYSVPERFIGEITLLNVWGNLLTKDTLYRLFSSCQRYDGDIYSWPDFQVGIMGQIRFKRSTFCRGCEILTNPKHGSLVGEGVAVGDVVKSSCKEGYELHRGEDTRTCLITGRWSGEEAECKAISCGFPGAIHNGHVRALSHDYGEVVSYSCSRGFKPVQGNIRRTCQANGEWSGEAPQCEVIRCPIPTPMENGILVSKSVTYLPNSKVTFSCQEGFRMEGTSQLACGHNGIWRGRMPSCQPVSCEVLPNILHGIVHAEYNSSRKFARVACESGYISKGKEVILCKENNEWESFFPKCVMEECKDAPPLANGKFQIIDFGNRKAVEYKCNPGFSLKGDKIFVCGSRLKVLSPRCIPVLCPPPNVPPFARTPKKAFWSVGDVVIFECIPGYAIKGMYSITCVGLSEGYWDGETPQCEEVKCLAPPLIDAGLFTMVRKNMMSHENKLKRELNHGLNAIAVTAQRPAYSSSYDFAEKDFFNNIWEQLSYFQRVINSTHTEDIDEQDYILNEYKVLEGGIDDTTDETEFDNLYSYNSLLKFECREGYTLLGEDTFRCTENGEWDHAPPRCYEQHCPDLEFPENGHLRYIGSGPLSRVEVFCNPGFWLESEIKEIICFINKTWSWKVPECRAIHCEEPLAATNGKVSLITTGFGAISTYSCLPGFVLEGNFERVCQSDGSWSGSLPRCRSLVCPDLPAIDNGFIDYGGQLRVGSSVSYGCDKCYKLIGPIVRTCQADQTWSHADPYCDLISCQMEFNSRLMNGKSIGGHACGSIMEYECDPGYEIQGPSIISCMENGNWTFPPPICQEILCSPPPKLQNGQAIGNSFNFTDKVKYICDTGFTLEGNDIITCNSDGKWLGEVPTCQSNCPIQNSLLHGKLNLLHFGASAFATCDPGYVLKGETILTCQTNGSWDQELPTCEPIVICSSLPNFPHALQDSPKGIFTSFESVRYKCKDGYTDTSVNSVLTCNESGQWEGDIIKCSPISCGYPETLKYGEILGDKYTFTSALKFICNEGYYLFGPTESICQENGKWTEFPSCEEIVSCEPPETPIHGTVTIVRQNGTLDTTALYTCTKGYILNGFYNRTCLVNGEWLESPPICQPLLCPKPTNLQNVIFFGDSFEYLRNITFSCQPGYLLKGRSLLTCLETGLWSSEFPRCEIITCPDPGYILNGIRIDRKMKPMRIEEIDGKVAKLTSLMNPDGLYREGDLIEYSCHEGYLLSLNEIIECTKDGWSFPVPSCNPVSCSFPGTITNGKVIGEDYVFRSIISYHCHTGYYLDGVGSRECLPNGQWTGIMPQCLPVTCSPPSSIENGNTKFSELTYHSIVSYSCKAGFELHGSATRICEVNGYWSGSQPFCLEIFCDEPEAVLYAVKEIYSLNIGGTVKYSCVEGFRMAGSASLNCHANGTWDKIPPKCVRVDCGIPSLTPHLYFTGASTKYPSKIDYFCERGYKLEGSKFAVCLQSAHWSGESPKCNLITCPSPPITEHVSIRRKTRWNKVAFIKTSEFEQYTVGDEITFSCEPGWTPVDEIESVCTEDGVWSLLPGVCTRLSCGLPAIPKHGFISGRGHFFGDVVKLSCENGFWLSGNATMVCQSDGTWSQYGQQCEGVFCGFPSSIPHSKAIVDRNGKVLVDSHDKTLKDPEVNYFEERSINREYTFGETVTYICEKGRISQGYMSSVCQSDGHWSTVSGHCVLQLY